jgi:hypothetical protein
MLIQFGRELRPDIKPTELPDTVVKELLLCESECRAAVAAAGGDGRTAQIATRVAASWSIR